MSGRNVMTPLSSKGVHNTGLAPFMGDMHLPRSLGPLSPQPNIFEEMRDNKFGMDLRRFPPNAAGAEDRLSAHHQEIQGLLADNQRLAATHVALKQELEATQHELQKMAHFARSMNSEKEVQMRELYEKSSRLDADLRGVEVMRNELLHVNADVKELADAKQDLTGQLQAMSQDLSRYNSDLHHVPALKSDIENMKKELQHARAAIEYEKEGYAKNFEHGRVMERKLVVMARELEKLRAEIANAEKRPHPPAVAGNQAYNTNYGNVDPNYPGGAYPSGYGMNPAQGNPDGYPPQYAAAPGQRATYDMQQRGPSHR